MIPADLAAAVAAAQDAPAGQAIDLIRPFLRDTGWFDALLVDGCAAMAADPRHLPAFRASRNGATRHLILARTERIWLSATVIDPTARMTSRVHFSGRHSLCRPLNRAMEGHLFTLAGDRAVAMGAHTVAMGDLLELDERRETLRIHAGETPLMVLRVQVAPSGPVRSHIHDGVTGAPVASAQTDEGHARALMLLSLLRVQGRTDAAAQFEAALETPLGGQRWAVMREYLALDTRAALPALRAMIDNDMDGAVRMLAAQTLGRLEGASCPA